MTILEEKEYYLKLSDDDWVNKHLGDTKKRPLEGSRGRWKHALQVQRGIIPPGGGDGRHGHDGDGIRPGAARAASLH